MPDAVYLRLIDARNHLFLGAMQLDGEALACIKLAMTAVTDALAELAAVDHEREELLEDSK